MSNIIKEDKRLTDNLRETAKDFVKLKGDRRKTAKKLYDNFLHKLIFKYESDKKITSDDLKKFFGKDKIRIVAVDGTMKPKARRGVIVFYALAAPLLYELDLSGDIPKLYRIEESSTRQTVMIMVPVPLSEVYRISPSIEKQDEEETISEEEELDYGDDLDVFLQQRKMGKIDLSLMKLTEVYTIDKSISELHPDVILVDGSLQEMYAWTNRTVDSIFLHHGSVLGIKTKKHDYTILKSLPTNKELQIPSKTNLRRLITAEILENDKVIIKKINDAYSWESKFLNETLSLTKRDFDKLCKIPYLKFTEENNTFEFEFEKDFQDSEKRLEQLYTKVCQEGFDKNNLEAFKIKITEEEQFFVYMGENEIQTIARIGFNKIFKNCWEKDILLVSVAKDSYVRFFIDNFLAVGGQLHHDKFDLDLNLLPRVPSTDTGVLYDISLDDNRLKPPIATTEFDTAIATIFRKYDSDEKKFIVARGFMVAQERQFLRTIVQLTQDSEERKSFAYTIDRITYPKHDTNYSVLSVEFGTNKKIRHDFIYYEKPSKLSKIILGLFNIISSNRHSSVFGYPDPLFEVDQYVKTIGRSHLETLDLALTQIDLDEFSVSYRDARTRSGG